MSQNYLSPAERRCMSILDAYGSQPTHWPADERQATLDCIAQSTRLQHYQAQLAELDTCIESARSASLPTAHEVQVLQQRILASLPDHPGMTKTVIWHRVFDWLATPRHAVALLALAILTIVLSIPHSPTTVAPRQTNDNSYAAWSWYDITDQDLPAVKHHSVALTMTEFVNLDVDEDGNH